jgi:hypothetical protein
VPGAGVRDGTLGSIVGYFGGDSAASTLNFKMFGESGLQLGKMITGGLTSDSQPRNLLGYLKKQTGVDLSGNLNTLVNGIANLFLTTNTNISAPILNEKPEQNEKMLEAIDKLIASESHMEGLLIELFNPQTYPARDFMNYALLDKAKSKNRVLNEVTYNELWTRKKAQYLADHFHPFLDNLWEFLYAQEFVPWLQCKISKRLGVDINHLYTAENLDCLLMWFSQNYGGFLDCRKLDELFNVDGRLGLLTRQFQHTVDVNAALETINNLIDYENATVLRAKVAAIPADNRDAFVAMICEILEPLAPLLKLFLTGGRTTDRDGRLIQTIWEGELYPNNGANDLGFYAPGNQSSTDPKNYVYNQKRYLEMEEAADNYDVGAITQNRGIQPNTDSDKTFQTIGAEGDNLTFLEDFLGFSGYDGYRQGIIPIYEHLGVPQRDIPDYQQFVWRATDPVNGNTEFFKMLINPLLNMLDNLIEDPICEPFKILPNLVYFMKAEGGNEQMLSDGSAGNNFVEAVNRILRPAYAILDMTTPLMSLGDTFDLLGVEYPFKLIAGGVNQDVRIAPDISFNNIAAGWLRDWFAEFSDSLGLELTLALDDILDLMTGTLVVYNSKNGQNDAVRLDGNLPDMLTNFFRKVITLIFSEENWPEMRVYIAARLPDNTRDIVLIILDGFAAMMRDNTLGGNMGADLILNVLFYLFYDADSLVNELLTMRDVFSSRIISFFEWIAQSRSPQLRRFAERARRMLDLYYSNMFDLVNGIQKNGFVLFMKDFLGKITTFFNGFGNWFMRVVRWLFPFFFR